MEVEQGVDLMSGLRKKSEKFITLKFTTGDFNQRNFNSQPENLLLTQNILFFIDIITSEALDVDSFCFSAFCC